MLYKAMAIDEERKKLIKSLGILSSIGISVILAIAIGVYIGLKLDQWLGTAPWFFFIFLIIGIVAGFRNIFVIIGRELKKNGSGEDNRK
jgi:ATP synthase protein I